MARASNIYVIRDSFDYIEALSIVGVFTVKHEALIWAKKQGLTYPRYRLLRYRDGYRQAPPVEIEKWDDQ